MASSFRLGFECSFTSKFVLFFYVPTSPLISFLFGISILICRKFTLSFNPISVLSKNRDAEVDSLRIDLLLKVAHQATVKTWVAGNDFTHNGWDTSPLAVRVVSLVVNSSVNTHVCATLLECIYSYIFFLFHSLFWISLVSAISSSCMYTVNDFNL
jgi:hypothetical protein